MVSTPSSYSTVGVAPVDGRSLTLHLGKELNGIVSYCRDASYRRNAANE